MCIVRYDNEGTVIQAFNGLDMEAEAEIKKYAGYLMEIERRRVRTGAAVPYAVDHYCILLAKAIFTATHHDGDMDRTTSYLSDLLEHSPTDHYVSKVLAVSRKRHTVWYQKNNPRNAYR